MLVIVQAPRPIRIVASGALVIIRACDGPCGRGQARGSMNSFQVRPRVSELIFQVYGRPLHPELFDILAMHRFEREDYTLRVWITRTGHVITWENPDVLLTETTVAGDQELPESRRLYRYRLRGEHAASLPSCHGIVYQTSFQVETLSPEIFLHVHDEILADGEKRGLLHNFQPNHRLAISPLGHVIVEARPGCLLVSAFHTFPEEHTVIKSQTLIERRRG
jgi:hypothetical protein